MGNLTYKPGLPVQVEKLKKYSARPTGSPGSDGEPLNARRAWATGESKRFFWIYERSLCWCGGVIDGRMLDLPALGWPWLGLLLSHRQPIRPRARSEQVRRSNKERRQTRSYKIIDQRQDDRLHRCSLSSSPHDELEASHVQYPPESKV